MNRTAVIIVGVVLAAAVVALVIWLLTIGTQPVTQPTSESTNTGGSQQEGSSDNVPLSTEGNTDTVVIENMAFNPGNTTVKKGATVTWLNNDNVQHNVVSDDNAPEGGPPKTNELFSEGGTYQFMYNTVGTFPYHCSVHPEMKGTVTVVE